MKPRARRVTFAAAVLGAAIVAVLMVLNWATVRDHAEAWWIQLTRETETILPNQSLKEVRSIPFGLSTIDTPDLSFASFVLLAKYSGVDVVFTSDWNKLERVTVVDLPDWNIDLPTETTTRITDRIRSALEKDGWRVLEQRFPRRAYGIRDKASEGAP